MESLNYDKKYVAELNGWESKVFENEEQKNNNKK